jgi:hypothetical protein
MDEAGRAAVRRVLNTIPDPAAKVLVSDVLRFALISLGEFANMDESIYAFFADGSIQIGGKSDDLNAALTEVMLTEVHGRTFRSIRRLTAYLDRVAQEGATADSALDKDEGAELDFGDAFDLALSPTSSPRAPNPTLSGLEEFDIEKAFDFVTGSHDVALDDKVAEYRKEACSIGAVLGRELKEFDDRIRASLSRQQFDAALRDLDAARETLSEGLFALVVTTFEKFLGDEEPIDRGALLPGYRNALQRSLVIRRGLALLRRVVSAENDWVIQDDSIPEAEQRESMARLADELRAFVKSEPCRLMRAPDRLELEAFVRKIDSEPFDAARLACEGLAKYLESLSVVNQREVLLHHDQDVIREIRQSLEAARSLIDISANGAFDLVREAIRLADQLYGRSSPLDEQLDQWHVTPPDLGSPQSAREVIGKLEALVC